ncbi:MAG TPA: hypothetical protein VHQ87_01905 [Rhizobacter sp.]|nr:hypothetical protein [Rhizobacter sp.]
MSDELQRCASCYGTGEIGTENGPRICPDCAGLGRLPSGVVLTERRLRELERIHSDAGELHNDIHWLVAEVRRARHSLLQILAASQDLPEEDAIGVKIRFLSNEVLGFYTVQPVGGDADDAALEE